MVLERLEFQDKDKEIEIASVVNGESNGYRVKPFTVEIYSIGMKDRGYLLHLALR